MRKYKLFDERTGLAYLAFVLLCGIMCLMLKCSCEKEKAPAERYGFVTFELNWDRLMPTHNIPAHLRYCFYPSNSGGMIQTEGDANSLKIALPPDNYRVLVFNCDVEYLHFQSMGRYETAEAYFPTSADSDYPSVSPLYVAVIDTIIISSGQSITCTIEPKAYVQQVSFHIIVENPAEIDSCSASLSEVPRSMNFNTRGTGVTACTTLPFSLKRTMNGFTQNLYLLDILSEDITKPHIKSNMLQVNFSLKNKRIVSSTVDLGFLLSAHDRENIQVEVNAQISKTTVPSVSFSNWKVKTLTAEKVR